MRIHPEMKALRGNPVSQRRVQEAMEGALAEWSSEHRNVELADALEAYARDASLSDCQPLWRLLHQPGAASGFIAEWAGFFSRRLANQKLGFIPFRHNYSPGLSTLQLIASGTASLSLVTYEEKPGVQRAKSAVFADRCQHEVVIAGRAQGYVHRRDPVTGAITSEARLWEAGDAIHLPGEELSREICAVGGRFQVLQLVRAAKSPRATCEYRLEDGALLHRSCADKQVSQAEMALAVLGEMGRADAVPVMAELAGNGPAHLRWEAMRHALALDPLEGIALLSAVARSTGDELQVPAARLLEQLEHAHPQLFSMEAEKCPA